MLAQRRRRWTNIKSTLDQRFVFNGILKISAGLPQLIVLHSVAGVGLPTVGDF